MNLLILQINQNHITTTQVVHDQENEHTFAFDDTINFFTFSTDSESVDDELFNFLDDQPGTNIETDMVKNTTTLI